MPWFPARPLIEGAINHAQNVTFSPTHGIGYRPPSGNVGAGTSFLGSAISATNQAMRPPRPKPPTRPKPSGGSRPSGGSSGRPGAGSGSQRVTGASGGASGSADHNHRVVRRPRTFTDGQGNVRRVRSSRAATSRPAGPKVDPISKIVDDIIAGMNRPLDEQRRQLVEQSIGNINQTNRLHEFYDDQTQAITNESQADFGTMLARAAELKGMSADTIAKHQDYLKSLVGPSNGGTMDQQIAAAAGATQSDLAATNDAFAKDLAAEGQSLSGVMGQLRVAGRAAQREVNQQELLARSAGEREINAAKAGNDAQRAQLYRQIQAEERDAMLKQQVAEAEWGLKSAQAQSLDNYRQGQLALGAARLDQQAANANRPKPEDASIYGNIPKRYQAAVKEAYDKVFIKDADGNRVPVARPWRSAWNLLSDRAGLNPTTAALLASKWFPDSIGESNPRNIRAMLANRGVSTAAQKRIITQYFGAGGWAQANRRPGLAGAIDYAGQQIQGN